MALVVALAVVAVQAVAAPGPVTLAQALQIDPAAICHAVDPDSTDQAGQAHDCCLVCTVAPLCAGAPALPGRTVAAKAVLLPAAFAGPDTPAAPPAYAPRGPPPAAA